MTKDGACRGCSTPSSALDSLRRPVFRRRSRDVASARAPWVVAAGGTRIAFLGIDAVTANYEVEPGLATGVLDVDVGATTDGAGTNPYLVAQVVEDIAAATAVADVVIPYFHLGAEYVAVVPPWAVQAAHAAIDAGAAMVVTNHPHLIQGMEVYAGKPIVYSLGNFILDQMWAAEVRSGYALEIILRGTTIVGLRFHGVEIEDFHQPRPMSSGEQAALMDRFWAATDRLAGREGSRGSILSPRGPRGASCLNLAQGCLRGGNGFATALEPLLRSQQASFIAGERGHGLGETLFCLALAPEQAAAPPRLPAARSFTVRLCCVRVVGLVAMRSFRFLAQSDRAAGPRTASCSR